MTVYGGAALLASQVITGLDQLAENAELRRKMWEMWLDQLGFPGGVDPSHQACGIFVESAFSDGYSTALDHVRQIVNGTLDTVMSLDLGPHAPPDGT